MNQIPWWKWLLMASGIGLLLYGIIEFARNADTLTLFGYRVRKKNL